MKRKILIISAAALALVLLLVILIPKKNPYPVAAKIQAYLDQFEEDELVSVNLANFTDFEWDKVVVFSDTPSEEAETNNLTEKEYLQIKDIMSKVDVRAGMIFIRNEKAIYIEYFDFRHNERENEKFKIYTKLEAGEADFRAFTLDEANFKGKYFIYGYHPYTVWYRLYPIE